MNTIEVFQNAEFGSVRVINKDGEPWFVAKDMVEALGYNPDSKVEMLLKHIPDEWKGVNQISTPDGINAYHVDVVAIFREELFQNPGMLIRYRKREAA